jgi:sigma-B regulation protein RsbU (phosphoserine phosphatase)
MPGQRAMFAGLLLFFLAFSYDHLVNFKLGVFRARVEPFGFLILIACIGRVVARRVALNEAEWISMSGEMQAARRIQESILPSKMPTFGDWTISARYSPMTSVAGDFYSFPAAHPDSLDVVIADVMGHGVPAALIASMIKVSVFAGAEKLESAPAILGDLNSTLCKDAPGQYASAAYVSLDRRGGIGRYTSAGHPPPLLRRRKARRIDRLDQSGLLLGVEADQIYQETVFRFDKGDRLLLYSDGLTEPENQAGVSFGDGLLLDLLAGSDDLTAEQFASALLQGVLRWQQRGPEPRQTDDITLVVVDLGNAGNVAVMH